MTIIWPNSNSYTKNNHNIIIIKLSSFTKYLSVCMTLRKPTTVDNLLLQNILHRLGDLIVQSV